MVAEEVTAMDRVLLRHIDHLNLKTNTQNHPLIVTANPPPLPRLKPKTIRMSKIFKKIESVIIDKMIMLI